MIQNGSVRRMQVVVKGIKKNVRNHFMIKKKMSRRLRNCCWIGNPYLTLNSNQKVKFEINKNLACNEILCLNSYSTKLKNCIRAF